MRTRIGTILIAVVALVVGAAAGWFAAGLQEHGCRRWHLQLVHPREAEWREMMKKLLATTFLALWWEISLMKVHGKLRYSPMKVYAHAIYSLMKVQ